jgi:hypothetical protein
MDTGFLTMIIIGIIVVVVISFLVRSFIKFIIIGVIVYFLFHMGFIWGVGDLNEKLQLDKLFNSSANEKIQSSYDTFAEKRDEHAVVNTNEVKKIIDTTIQKAITEAGNHIKSVDKEALLKELQEKLKAYEGDSVEKAVLQSEPSLKKVMTPEQIKALSSN